LFPKPRSGDILVAQMLLICFQKREAGIFWLI